MARSTEPPAAAPAPATITEAATAVAAAPLLLLILVDAIGFAMLTPLLAATLSDGSGSALDQGLTPNGRHLLYGVATGLYPILTFLGAPILGQLSDRLGRKPILLVCAGGIFASYLVLAAAFALGSIPLLLAGRAIGGLTAASQAVSLASLVEVCRPQRKDFWLSMGLLCSSLGFVVGPALSGVLSNPAVVPWFNVLTPLYATAALAGLNLAMLVLLFHDRRARPTEASPVSILSGFRSFGAAFARPGPLRDVSWVFLLQELAWGAYFYFVPVMLLRRYGIDGASASYFMSVMGIGFCLSFAVAMPLLTRYFTARAIAFLSLVVTSALIAASAFAPSMTGQWLVILPIAIAVAVSYGALIVLFTDTADENSKGEVMGITAAINSLSFGTVSFLGGAAEGLGAGIPIYIALALMSLSALVLAFQKSQPKERGTTT